VTDISGGPCRDHNYVLEQIHLHWGEDDSEGSEHLINASPFAAEVYNLRLSTTPICCLSKKSVFLLTR